MGDAVGLEGGIIQVDREAWVEVREINAGSRYDPDDRPARTDERRWKRRAGDPDYIGIGGLTGGGIGVGPSSANTLKDIFDFFRERSKKDEKEAMKRIRRDGTFESGERKG